MPMPKKIISHFIDIIKSFFLNNLNDYELKGFVTFFTNFHFLPYTKIMLPFHLGRTIRGVSFDKNFYQDPYGKLCTDISEGVDYKILYSNLQKELDREKNLSAAEIIHLDNNIILKNYPAWSIVMPWEKIDIKKKFNSYPSIFFNKQNF